MVVANVLVAVGGETRRVSWSFISRLGSVGFVEVNVKLVSPFLHSLPVRDVLLINHSQMFSAAAALFVVVAPVWRREINNRHVSESVTA